MTNCDCTVLFWERKALVMIQKRMVSFFEKSERASAMYIENNASPMVL